ncbi:MAG: carbohydrate-binding family 9-like protein [Polyangiaceae bacterium]
MKGSSWACIRSSARPLLLAALCGLCTACVDDSGGKKVDKAALAKFVLASPPADVGTKLNADFDGKITLLGARVEPKGVVRPGSKLKVTMYWQVKQPLGEEGWNLFTHVLDGSGERILNIDNVGPLRQLEGNHQAMWPSAWEAGKVYVDEQEFTVPASIKTTKLQITTGIWKDTSRIPIKSGPKDAHNRAIVATLNTGVTPGAVPRSGLPSLRVTDLLEGQTIQIDGKLDEAAWKGAASTGPFIDVRSGKPNARFPVNGSVKLLWDQEHLYLGFEIKDKKVTGGFDAKQTDPHLWTKDTVEIMTDPDGDGDNKDYYEIQINPQNLVFDSQFDDYNKPKVEPDGPFGHQDWSAKLKSAVTINGTLDDDDDEDQGYVVEVAIPWKSFSKAKQAPPKPGDTWRMNFYAMENNGGVAWSPILGQGNFHKAARFGRVTWASSRPAAPPGASGGAASAGSAAPSSGAAPSANPPTSGAQKKPKVVNPGKP